MAGALLTREGLEALLAFLDPDRDRAGEKYEEIRRRLIKLFECRGIVPADEPADETIDRVARRLAEGEQIRVASPAAYFYGVARNVLRERWALQKERRVGPPPGLLAAEPSREHEGGLDDIERWDACLQKCLATLPPETQRLVLDYYRPGRGVRKILGRKELAAELGISTNTLWVRAHRARSRLERCVRECLDRQGASKRPPGPLKE